MPATPLQTDLYQLTMVAGYVTAGIQDEPATFELFIRRLPPHRAVVVFAGLETALEYIETLRITESELAWLRTLPALSGVAPAVFDYLKGLRFTGDVWAMAEGTPFFPYEPVLRVTAPLGQAQLLETTLLSILNFQTSIASKAVRLVAAAGGRAVMEFGSRRAHGPDAALYAARAAFVAGCESTSFVEAGRQFGVPLAGTMAHSWVQAFGSELEAFRRYTGTFGDRSVLLLDTYDTIAAAEMIAASGLRPAAVRIDSGDFLDLSRRVRGIFDAAGLQATRILVSGDLDERRISTLVAAGAPIDGFGVGTALSTSEDAPALGGVYKLVEIGRGDRIREVVKRSTGKGTWPAVKQVYREVEHGTCVRDVIALAGERVEGRPLLERVLHAGQREVRPRPLHEIRDRARAAIAEIPGRLLSPDAAPSYDVRQSDGLASRVRAAEA